MRISAWSSDVGSSDLPAPRSSARPSSTQRGSPGAELPDAALADGPLVASRVPLPLKRIAMASRHDTMMNPPIEGLLERAGSKFTLVTLASKRARQINSYSGQRSQGLRTVVPPPAPSSARKPPSTASEEIQAHNIPGACPARPEGGLVGKEGVS